MEAKKYTLKCTEENCGDAYYARNLCRRHYKMLLGREGGYKKAYAKRSTDPVYKEMKSKSDKAYKDKLRKKGLLGKFYKNEWKKIKADPERLELKLTNQRLYELRHRDDPEYRKRKKQHQRTHRDVIRMKVLNYYGNNAPKCLRCGYDNVIALCLDHINNDGVAHKKRLTNKRFRHVASRDIYRDVIRNNFPKEYQILCWNCNYVKEYERRKLLQQT